MRHGIFVSLFLTIVLGIPPDAIAANVDATVSKTISITQVKKLCVPPNEHTYLQLWNIYGGYLLCTTGDTHTAGIELLKLNAKTNEYTNVAHTGGYFNVSDLNGLHVSTATAKKLLDGMHK